MHDACQESGVESTLIRVEGATHGFYPLEEHVFLTRDEAEQMAIEFFIKHLMQSGQT